MGNQINGLSTICCNQQVNSLKAKVQRNNRAKNSSSQHFNDIVVSLKKAGYADGPKTSNLVQSKTGVASNWPVGAEPFTYKGEDYPAAIQRAVSPAKNQSGIVSSTINPSSLAGDPKTDFPGFSADGNSVKPYGGPGVPDYHKPDPRLTDPITGQEILKNPTKKQES